MSRVSEHSMLKSRTLTLTHDIPISKTQKYWDELKKGKVYATKCKKCGKIYYPPQADCPNCLTSDVEWIQLLYGNIETFTQVYLKPQGFTHYAQNYIIAIAKTAEGAKVMGWLEGMNVDIAKIGTPVEITAKVMPDGFPAIFFKFKNNK